MRKPLIAVLLLIAILVLFATCKTMRTYPCESAVADIRRSNEPQLAVDKMLDYIAGEGKNQPCAYVILFWGYAQLNDFENAMMYYDKAIELDPNSREEMDDIIVEFEYKDFLVTRREAARSVIASAYLSEGTRIAILDFEPLGVPESEAATVSELFRSALFNTRRFVVIERSRMGEIFEEQGFVLSGCTDVECAVTAGEILDVEVILIGSLSKLGSKYILSVRGVDVSDARVVLNETAEHTGAVEELSEVVNRLARKVAGGSGGM